MELLRASFADALAPAARHRHGRCMPQPLRIEYLGAWFHVFARAVWGREVFLEDIDRRFFLRRLSLTVARYQWACTGYCLMDTHHHLLVRLTRPNLALGMQELHSVYARCFNERHGRHGHVFSERYEPVLLETEAHLLQAHRYVVRNPVEAGLCETPADWRWSSYRATAGMAPCPRLLDLELVLSLFHADRRAARARYRAFVAATEDDCASGTSQIVASGGSVTVAA
jgi:putative transposase